MRAVNQIGVGTGSIASREARRLMRDWSRTAAGLSQAEMVQRTPQALPSIGIGVRRVPRKG